MDFCYAINVSHLGWSVNINKEEIKGDMSFDCVVLVNLFAVTMKPTHFSLSCCLFCYNVAQTHKKMTFIFFKI